MFKKTRTTEERFWSLVRKTDDCWLWTGTGSRGYGHFPIDGKKVKAHRYSWFLANGPIPTGMLVCHHCDNPPCVNPAHLFLGTPAANTADMDRKRRRPIGDRHPNSRLTENDVRMIRVALAGGESQSSIARRLGVSFTTIYFVRTGKLWAHVDATLDLRSTGAIARRIEGRNQ